jgi:DUF4097 and DUF4098 domain-containing protein YvlB
MQSKLRSATLAVVSVALVTAAIAQTRKEYRYTVRPRASVSVTNQYGPISVTSTPGNQVIVRATLPSNKVEVDQDQNGNRVDILSHLLQGATATTGRVDYEVQVPADTNVTLRSSTGPLRAEKLRGDVTLEGAGATVDVRDVSNAHVHVKTLNGPVTLTNIRQGHVEITSVSGAVTLNAVSGPFVQVNSTSGKIHYDGDFGSGGDYELSSHSGDIEAAAPTDASIDVSARSIKGQVENDFPLQPKAHTVFPIDKARAFVGTAGKAASKVVLHTISGTIRLKKH